MANGRSWADRVGRFFAIDDAWQRPRPPLQARDLVLAASVWAFGLLTLELAAAVGAFDRVGPPRWVQWLVVSTGALLLIGRRRWPLTVALLAAAHMFLAGVSMPEVMSQLTLQLVYFTAILSGVAWATDRRTMLLVIGAIVIFMFGWIGWQFAIGAGAQELLDSIEPRDRDSLFAPIPAAVTLTVLVNVLYFGGAVVGGQMLWRSARQQARLTEQATTIAEQAADLQRRVVLDERLRIARELHDVVAHHVAVIGVQAGGARRVLTKDPAAAAEALGAVEVSAREAISSMRGLVGTLRDTDAIADRPRSPAPGLVGLPGLPGLIAEYDGSSFESTYDLVVTPPGADRRLSAPIEHSLYRTVQEALTNIAKHSTATRAGIVVRIDETAGFAEVEVTDNGRSRAGTSGSGLGQLGIRERAASHRGEVEIGPRVTGGYRVRVRLPLGTAQPAGAALRGLS